MAVRVSTPESSQTEDLIFVPFDDRGGICYVYFRSGAIYAYDLSREEWEAFQAAPSKGAFVQTLHVYRQIRGR